MSDHSRGDPLVEPAAEVTQHTHLLDRPHTCMPVSSGTLPGTMSCPIHDLPNQLNLSAVTQLLNSGCQAAAGGAAPTAEEGPPMFPQFPGYKPSGRVISTRVLGTNHMCGGMPGAHNMAPQQSQYNLAPQYPQYPHMAPPAQHGPPPPHQGPYGPPYGPPHADSEECAMQREHFAQQRDETEVATSQRQDVAPPEYRGFNFVPRTSEGSTSHTSCPYYGFHDLPPGHHACTMPAHMLTTSMLTCSHGLLPAYYSAPSRPPSQVYSAHSQQLPPRSLTQFPASVRFIPVWNQLEWRIPLLDHASLHCHTATHSLSLVLVVMIKPKELKIKISHTHSLILPHSLGYSAHPHDLPLHILTTSLLVGCAYVDPKVSVYPGIPSFTHYHSAQSPRLTILG